jgi:hypothetical protein
LLDDAVAFMAANIDDEAHAASVVFVRGMVQALRGRKAERRALVHRVALRWSGRWEADPVTAMDSKRFTFVTLVIRICNATVVRLKAKPALWAGFVSL